MRYRKYLCHSVPCLLNPHSLECLIAPFQPIGIQHTVFFTSRSILLPPHPTTLWGIGVQIHSSHTYYTWIGVYQWLQKSAPGWVCFLHLAVNHSECAQHTVLSLVLWSRTKSNKDWSRKGMAERGPWGITLVFWELLCISLCWFLSHEAT